jgi:hypothetical protein
MHDPGGQIIPCVTSIREGEVLMQYPLAIHPTRRICCLVAGTSGAVAGSMFLDESGCQLSSSASPGSYCDESTSKQHEARDAL